MDSDSMPNFDEAADHLTNHDISFLVSDEPTFALGGENDESQNVSFDTLFQNSFQVRAAPQSVFDVGMPPLSIAPLQPLGGAQAGFLPNPAAAPSSPSHGSPVRPAVLLPSMETSESKKRSRTCSFFFDTLTTARAPAFVRELVVKLCAVQKSGSANGVKLERNPTFFVDAYSAQKTPRVGVWVLFSSSASNLDKWNRVAKTIGSSSHRMIPQNHGSGRLTHGYEFTAQQFGLAADDAQMFNNVVICDELPQVFFSLFLLLFVFRLADFFPRAGLAPQEQSDGGQEACQGLGGRGRNPQANCRPWAHRLGGGRKPPAAPFR